MRFTICAVALCGLAACSSNVPAGSSGVGFGDYNSYLAAEEARAAALAGTAIPPAGAISSESTAASAPLSATATEPSMIAADTQAVLAQTGSTQQQAPLPQTVTTTSGISSENDFDAVGAQRSIEDDAELLAHNRQQYQVVEPTALPTRSGNASPNIVDYAVNSTNPIGVAVYNRNGYGSGNVANKCARYASADEAQAAFLAKGGPTKDKIGLDPDGDGFACGWDPTPFRKALGG